MDDDITVKLPQTGKTGLPTRENDANSQATHPQEGNGGGNAKPPFTPRVDQMPTAAFPPLRKVKTRWPLFVRVMIIVLLLLVLTGGFALVYGYYYVQSSVAPFIHQVSRGQDEPTSNVIPSDSNVAGKVWNILLLGSDNDGKYSFPALLTQVMMIVHVDTIDNSLSMVSIPRDSWVHVPEVNTMHKIDQAFFVGASQHNSFDD